VYISDRFNHQLRFVDEVGSIRAAVGNGVGMTWTCTGGDDESLGSTTPGPRRGRPSGLAVGGDGTVYLANKALPQVKRLESAQRVTTTIGRFDRNAACAPTGCGPIDGEPAAQARLISPVALAPATGGGLYVREADLPRVYFANLGRQPLSAQGITVAPGAIHTVAGDGVIGDEGDGGRALDARLAANGTLAVTGDGTLFLAEEQGGRVRQVGPDGVITTLAGGDGALVASSCCQAPSGLLVDPDDNLYVSDLGANQVWFLNRGSAATEVHGRVVGPGKMEVIAGTGQGGFAGEGGPAIDAQLDGPAAMALDAPGNLYVANLAPRDDSVRRIDPGGNITTIAGSSTGTGFNGDGLKARLTAFSQLTALALDGCGNLLVGEGGGDRVRRVNLVAPCGESAGGPPAPDPGGGSLPLPLAVAGVLAGGGAALWWGARRARRR
jgi:serine/threonine-protein kinase